MVPACRYCKCCILRSRIIVGVDERRAFVVAWLIKALEANPSRQRIQERLIEARRLASTPYIASSTWAPRIVRRARARA